MKKLVIALIALSFLASCGNKDEEINTNSWSTATWITQSWAILDDSDETDSSWTEDTINTGTWDKVNNIIEKENSNNTSNNKPTNTNNPKWNSWVSSSSGWANTKDDNVPTDDAELEKEVNDLLDEFINSLDNYDK